jgi:hypothetical protein
MKASDFSEQTVPIYMLRAEAGNWVRGQFGNPQERPLLEAANKQRLERP